MNYRPWAIPTRRWEGYTEEQLLQKLKNVHEILDSTYADSSDTMRFAVKRVFYYDELVDELKRVRSKKSVVNYDDGTWE